MDGKVQFYETGAIANADIAFDNLFQGNIDQLKLGRTIRPEDYFKEAELHPSLPVTQPDAKKSEQEQYKFDDRGKRIVAKMDCPCGCDDKVQKCTCKTSKNIKTALSTEDFKDQTDDAIIKVLNKRFCTGEM